MRPHDRLGHAPRALAAAQRPPFLYPRALSEPPWPPDRTPWLLWHSPLGLGCNPHGCLGCSPSAMAMQPRPWGRSQGSLGGTAKSLGAGQSRRGVAAKALMARPKRPWNESKATGLRPRPLGHGHGGRGGTVKALGTRPRRPLGRLKAAVGTKLRPWKHGSGGRVGADKALGA